MDVTEVGMEIAVSEVHPLKILLFNNFTLLPIVTDFNEVQDLNVDLPINDAELDITTDSNEVQDSKALSPYTLRVLSILIVTKFLHPKKRELGIDVTEDEEL